MDTVGDVLKLIERMRVLTAQAEKCLTCGKLAARADDAYQAFMAHAETPHAELELPPARPACDGQDHTMECVERLARKPTDWECRG